MGSRQLLLFVALGVTGCAPRESSSTGVGNPGVISLSIVMDDEPEPMAVGAAGATNETGDGGAPPEPVAAGGETAAAGAAGASNEAAGASNEAAGASNGAAGASNDAAGTATVKVPDDLPRANIEHAVIVLGALHWTPCDTTLEVTSVRGPFVVDLLGNIVPERTRPPIPDVVEPAGGFCGLEAPLAPADAPAEIAGCSLFFDGTRSDGTPFVLYANVEATLRVRRHDSVVWNANDTPAVLWAMRPRRWLSRMDLDQTPPLLPDGGGDPLVDVNRHPMLVGALRRHLAGKSSLFLDLNQNHELDTEDRAALVGDGSDDPD